MAAGVQIPALAGNKIFLAQAFFSKKGLLRGLRGSGAPPWRIYFGGIAVITMRLSGGAPIYEQLERRITELVLSGEMKEGDKLPAVREIAKQLSINPNTVQKTYANLEAIGMIYSIPAKGSYISERSAYIAAVSRKTRENFEEAVQSALRLGLSKNDLLNIVESFEDDIKRGD